jgi:beta-glucanase (GH16 family)
VYLKLSVHWNDFLSTYLRLTKPGKGRISHTRPQEKTQPESGLIFPAIDEKAAMKIVTSLVFTVLLGVSSSAALDCGIPTACTSGVLAKYAGDYQCGGRIQWLMSNKGMSEQAACFQIAVTEFPNECGPCNPAGINQAPPTTLPLALVGDPVWKEDFSSNGAPSNFIWNYDTGRGPYNDGWGNWEVQQYSSDSSNVFVSDGKLNIVVKKDYVDGQPAFTSARLKTNGKFEFQYGSVEASIKIPDLNGGLWPAFWLLGRNSQDVSWPKCGELDILEAGNKDSIAGGVVNKRVSSAAHLFDDSIGGYRFVGDFLTADSELDDGFHTYRMDWTPNFINTFIDGKLIWSFDIGGCKDTYCTEFHQPFYFLLNVAVGGTFTGITDKNLISSGGGQMQVDYIYVYNNEAVNAQLGSGIQYAPPSVTTTARAQAGSQCSAYTACAGLGGDCCPTADGVILDCCNSGTRQRSFLRR